MNQQQQQQQGFSPPLARRRSNCPPPSPNLVRTSPIEYYQALRDSAPCLSRAATPPKGTKLELKRGAHLGTPSLANHTAAASQPTGRTVKAASLKPGFGGRGHNRARVRRLVLVMKGCACCVLICHQQERNFGGWRTSSRNFASYFRVSYDILRSSWKRSSPCVPTTVVALKQPSQIIYTLR